MIIETISISYHQGLVQSIVNDWEEKRLAEIVYLNPLEYVNLYNRLEMEHLPDVLVPVSPAAGLTREQMINLIEYSSYYNSRDDAYMGYPLSRCEIIPLHELFHAVGAWVVVPITLLPDTYKYVYIETVWKKEYSGSVSTFPLIANKWLHYFLVELSKGVSVKEAAETAVSIVHNEYGDLWRDYIWWVAEAPKWMKYIDDAVQTLINLVENEGYEYAKAIDEIFRQYSGNILGMDDTVKVYYEKLLEHIADKLTSRLQGRLTRYLNAIRKEFEVYLETLMPSQTVEEFDLLKSDTNIYQLMTLTVRVIGNGDPSLYDPGQTHIPGGHHRPNPLPY